jgi:prevent-host-death family protein
VIREAAAVKVRQNLGELLNEVQYRRDSVVIMKDGKRVAAIVDIGLFDRIRAMEARFAEITGRIRSAFAGMEERAVERLLKEAVGDARGKAGRRRRAR